MEDNKLSRWSECYHKYFVKELLLLGLFFGFIFAYQEIEGVLQLIWPEFKPTIEWQSLPELALAYTLMVVSASLISFVIAFTMGVMIHVYKLHELKALMNGLVEFGVTFPTIALIALLIPVLGYGFKSVVLALILYGLLPILTNTIKGLETVEPSIVTSAQGMGMSPWQTFLYVERPLAMPLILAGIKTTVIINIAAASVGAIVGAGGLGMPIISGIRTNEPILILKGAIPITLMALLTDRLFYRLERKYE